MLSTDLSGSSTGLPEALSLIAGSLEAGHTFLHAIEMMVEESEPPLSQEFERVLSETRLGDPLMDALDRTGIDDVVRQSRPRAGTRRRWLGIF